MTRSFASDNNAPIAPDILDAIVAANAGDAVGYGDDPWTQRAIQAFRTALGAETEVLFAFNGTGANVAGLSALLRPWEAVVCPATAHLQTDECGALERFAGCKILAVSTHDGKLRPADLEPILHAGHGVHFAQPRIVSISQTTEFGDLYEVAEIEALTAFAHQRGLLVHVDGARLSNAAAALHASLADLTSHAGVDLLTMGGTKNGLMLGEAICFLSPAARTRTAAFVHKQAMQLASKMRYIAAQFAALLEDERWRRYAQHANAMTHLLHQRVASIAGIRITRPVRANAIFATMDRSAIERVRREFFFYDFDERLPEVRWMTHWATLPRDVEEFAAALAAACATPV